MQVQKRKRKKERKKKRKNIREKKGKKRETYTQALRKVKCAYTKKSDLSLEVNTARDFNDS